MTNSLQPTLNRVTEAVVRAEKAPEFTGSWHPYSHAQILDAVGVAVKDAGLAIVNKEYSIRPESKMIACWEVETPGKEFNHGISILNSIDKTHAVTLGCFEKIFVCSNFCFRMEYERVMFRKHSGALELEEIIWLAKEALKILIPKFKALSGWHAKMKEVKLDAEQAALLTLAAIRRGLLPPAKSPTFLDLFMGTNSKYKEFGSSLWAWHGASTELMNDNSILTIVAKQDRLNYFVDHEAPIVLKHGHDYQIDLPKIEKEAHDLYLKEREEKRGELRTAYAEIRDKFKGVKKEASGKIKEEKKKEKEAEKKIKAEEKSSQVQSGSKTKSTSDQSITPPKKSNGKKTSKKTEKTLSEKKTRKDGASITAVKPA